jgi:hypothetical protein
MTADELLKEGIAALKTGRKAEARSLLMRVTEQDERNEMAWLWLSGAVDTDGDRRICLENVLAINPNNEAGRRGLASLTAKEGVRPLSAASSPTPGAEPAGTPGEQLTQFPTEASLYDVAQRNKRRETSSPNEATRPFKNKPVEQVMRSPVLLLPRWLVSCLRWSPYPLW